MKQPVARDLMSRPVRRLTRHVTIPEAAGFLMRTGISGALVVDELGKPAGVFSLRDIATYVQTQLVDLPDISPRQERVRATGEQLPGGREWQFQALHGARVSDLMTPGVIAVGPHTPLSTLARLMKLWQVHRIFVEEDGEIRGVVTSMDVLQWAGRLFPKERRSRTRVASARR